MVKKLCHILPKNRTHHSTCLATACTLLELARTMAVQIERRKTCGRHQSYRQFASCIQKKKTSTLCSPLSEQRNNLNRHKNSRQTTFETTKTIESSSTTTEGFVSLLGYSTVATLDNSASQRQEEKDGTPTVHTPARSFAI